MSPDCSPVLQVREMPYGGFNTPGWGPWRAVRAEGIDRPITIKIINNPMESP